MGSRVEKWVFYGGIYLCLIIRLGGGEGWLEDVRERKGR